MVGTRVPIFRSPACLPWSAIARAPMSLSRFRPGDCPFSKCQLDALSTRFSARISAFTMSPISKSQRGGKFVVWPATGATQKDIEIFLLGPVWATLCHQRRILPLHASAIATETGIIAFAGHPGAGKSTIAAMLSTLNLRIDRRRHTARGLQPRSDTRSLALSTPPQTASRFDYPPCIYASGKSE